MGKYILAIDQSTQNTKAFLFDQRGHLVAKTSKAHQQLINEKGWISHNLEEIYEHLIEVVRELMLITQIDTRDIVAMGISNQRETAAAWSRTTGRPLHHALVWQCARAAELCEDIREEYGAAIREKTGMHLSPYFSAAKFAWMHRHIEDIQMAASQQDLCFGTIDSWLLFRLTGGTEYRTEVSNASRTQLLNIQTLAWDAELCDWFNIPMNALPHVEESNALFGYTDIEGVLKQKIPIYTMLGDSQSALFGQGCREKGTVKATIGTGSSVMMNIGKELVIDPHGLLTSVGWTMNGVTHYVLEGNINYAGAVIRWLKEDMQLVEDSAETQWLAKAAFPGDTTYLVPAFTGLGAPYWEDQAKAILCGMSRMTGRAEVVKASLDSIAYQIEDILDCIHQSVGLPKTALKVDGGVTSNEYLMQFQSNISQVDVHVPNFNELSALGAAYSAGIAAGLYPRSMKGMLNYATFQQAISEEERQVLLNGWHEAVQLIHRPITPKLVSLQ